MTDVRISLGNELITTCNDSHGTFVLLNGMSICRECWEKIGFTLKEKEEGKSK